MMDGFEYALKNIEAKNCLQWEEIAQIEEHIYGFTKHSRRENLIPNQN